MRRVMSLPWRCGYPEPDNMWDIQNNGSIATRGYNDELMPYIGTSVGRRNLRRNYAEDPKTPLHRLIIR